ncbi:MAG TPA: hypothetical protein VF167_06195 [Longimicrobiaceae bacterium]
MSPRDLAHRIAAKDAAPAPEHSGLEQALGAWKEFCGQAAAALERRDLDALEIALDRREALRPHIAEMVSRLERLDDEDGLRERLQQLERDSTAADARLVEQLRSELQRLKSEIEGLGRATAPAVAYAFSQEPRHRLDIRR